MLSLMRRTSSQSFLCQIALGRHNVQFATRGIALGSQNLISLAFRVTVSFSVIGYVTAVRLPFI